MDKYIANNNKILVFIHLFGGNDGLNTIIPIDQYENLYKHRKNIIIDEKKILKTKFATIGLHPSINKFNILLNEGYMSIIQNVGYPSPNRSHFRSTDIWNTGSPANKMWTSGWLGRYFDLQHNSYPLGYPNNNYKDPLSINIGIKPSDLSQGKNTNYSYSLNNLIDFNLFPEYIEKIDTNNINFSNEINFIASTIKLTNSYTKRIEKANLYGRNFERYDDDFELAQQLKIVAKLINGGLETKFYTLQMNGFDTHGQQTLDDTSLGSHANLLLELSESIYSFINDLRKMNALDRVTLVVSTEFGRQIKSNNSRGTDHGCASPMFIFTENINKPIYGDNPIIKNELVKQEAIDFQFDFRDIFGSILLQWLNQDSNSINNIFERNFSPINLFKNYSINL